MQIAVPNIHYMLSTRHLYVEAVEEMNYSRSEWEACGYNEIFRFRQESYCVLLLPNAGNIPFSNLQI